MTAAEKLQIVLEALDETKAIDINVVEVGDQTHLMDYLVICSGSSTVHLRAIADRARESLKRHEFRNVRCEGYQAARWILMDYGDVVVNVFDPEERTFYNLEAIWEKVRPAAA